MFLGSVSAIHFCWKNTTFSIDDTAMRPKRQKKPLCLAMVYLRISARESRLQKPKTIIKNKIRHIKQFYTVNCNCQLSKPGDKRNFNSQQDLLIMSRPADNVALTTKGLQKRQIQLLNGKTVEKQVININ